jgi:hypothetical protein
MKVISFTNWKNFVKQDTSRSVSISSRVLCIVFVLSVDLIARAV